MRGTASRVDCGGCMFEFLRRVFVGNIKQDNVSGSPLRAAAVFTTAVPEWNYVPRTVIEQALSQELDRRDKIICVTGVSKSGKTVVVTRRLPNTPIIFGQVGLKREDVWRTLCAMKKIPLRTKAGGKITTEAHAGIIKGGLEGSTHEEVDIDPRSAFLDFCREKSGVIFDDFHYFDKDTQRELLQGLRQLLHDRIAIVITLTHYGEDLPTLAEPDILARIRFIKIPIWSDEDLRQILSKGFDALNAKISTDDIKQIVDRSFGNPLIVQELGSFLCTSHGITETRTVAATINCGNADEFVRRAVREGYLAGDKPTFMNLIIGRTPPSGRSEYKIRDGGEGDVYFLVFSALRAFNLTAPIPYEGILQWIRENVTNERPPQGGQITTALDGLKRTSIELVKQQLDELGRSKEIAIEWRSDIRSVFVNDPFLRLYIKWADWNSEYRERLGQMKQASKS
jgi:hypothetical protein